MEYIFQAEKLRKNFGKHPVLDGLSMRIPAGAIYGFVGKNGAGKTTLLRHICGLQFPTGGSFTLYGAGNTEPGIHAARKRIGAMVESPAVYLHMTAEENLKQQYRILGLSDFQGIGELLELVGLEDTGKKKAGAFSQGMRQKLGIAVALCGNPDFVILDEPVNGLDPQGIIRLRELILQWNRERHTTFLLSSHILSELSRLATHYGFIDHGRMVQEMTAEELERACRKSLRVEVSDMAALGRALERMGVPWRSVSDSAADLFERVSLTKLAMELIQENCEIFTCREQDENLEEYFMNLVGGDQDA